MNQNLNKHFVYFCIVNYIIFNVNKLIYLNINCYVVLMTQVFTFYLVFLKFHQNLKLIIKQIMCISKLYFISIKNYCIQFLRYKTKKRNILTYIYINCNSSKEENTSENCTMLSSLNCI